MKIHSTAGTARAAAFVLCLLSSVTVADLTSERQQQLRHLLLQDCGSCHGLTLQGGLGPALTPKALHDKSPQALRTTILEGRPGTPMPPWKLLLTADEADWLVAQLQRGVNADAR